MSDLSEGEKEVSPHGGGTRGKIPRVSSVDAMENWARKQKEKKLYIVLIRYR